MAQGRASKKRIRARKVCRARLRAEAAPHGSAQLLDAQTRHVQTTVHFPFGGLGASYFFDLNCLKLHSPLAPQSSIAAAPAFPCIGLLVVSPTRFVQSPVCQPSCGKLCDQSSQSRSACASWSHQRSEQLRCSAHGRAEHQLRTTRQHSAARASAHWSGGLRIRLKI